MQCSWAVWGGRGRQKDAEHQASAAGEIRFCHESMRLSRHTSATSSSESLKANSSVDTGDWTSWVFRFFWFSDGQRLETTKGMSLCQLVFQSSFLEMENLKNKCRDHSLRTRETSRRRAV